MARYTVDQVGEKLGTAPRDVLEALLATVPDAVYVVDPDGRVEFANPAALAMLGYEESELLGRVSHPTIHHHHWDGTPFPVEECPMLRPRTTGETVRVDGDTFWRKDGSKFRVAYSSAPLQMSVGRGAVVVFRDVTSRIDAEHAARREEVERARAHEIHASRARIVEAADTERRRLVRDLHDGAQQRLVRILLSLRLAGSRLEQASPDVRALLDQAASDSEAAIEELRELGSGIHPQILTNRGLAAAVESLTGPIPLVVDLEISERRYPPTVEGVAYFVIAEGLTNVIKHSGASAATVAVSDCDEEIAVEIADDGCGGVDLGALRGLRGLQDRLDALDGTLQISSPPGGGTRLRAVLPLRSAS
jgi:PAS domain S-box-containing protein